MVLSNTTNRYRLSHLLALTFICALLIPVASHADDKKSSAKASAKDLYKQIEAAVIAGRITKEEAQAKLNALKKQGSSKDKAIKEREDKKSIAHLENIWAELQSLVAAGKMAQEEANAVMSTIKQKVFAENSANKKAQVKPSPKNLYKQIEAAVITGKITKHEAQAKLKALQQNSPQAELKGFKKKDSSKAEQGKAATEAYLKKVWAELQAAVAAGKLTKEQASTKMAAIKKAKLGKE